MKYLLAIGLVGLGIVACSGSTSTQGMRDTLQQRNAKAILEQTATTKQAETVQQCNQNSLPGTTTPEGTWTTWLLNGDNWYATSWATSSDCVGQKVGIQYAITGDINLGASACGAGCNGYTGTADIDCEPGDGVEYDWTYAGTPVTNRWYMSTYFPNTANTHGWSGGCTTDTQWDFWADDGI
jgi:hypothetical protein